MCVPTEDTGGDRHVHAVMKLRDQKGKMQTYLSHPMLELATAKRWWENFGHTWPRDTEISFDWHVLNDKAGVAAAD